MPNSTLKKCCIEKYIVEKINASFLFSIDTTKLIFVEIKVTEHVLLQIELKMKKAEGIRWSSLEGEDEVKAKPIPKQGQSC